MSEIEKIINEVDSSMAMEGLPLTVEDRERIKSCLIDPGTLNTVLADLLKKHTVAANA